MLDLNLDIEIVDGYFAMDAEGAVHDSWQRIKTALAELGKSPNIARVEIPPCASFTSCPCSAHRWCNERCPQYRTAELSPVA